MRRSLNRLALIVAVGSPFCLAGARAQDASSPGATSAGRPGYRVEVVATDLRVPWSMALTPDGSLLFTERPGRVRVIRNGKLLQSPLLTVDDIDTTGKLGLMGMALHPQFASNHWLYLAYSYSQGGRKWVRVVRYRESKDALSDPKVILENIPAATNHAGCRLRFGPDRKLYITTGDADDPNLAQKLDSLAGKILRLDYDGSVPSDNPFVKDAAARSEIWSYGHRNSQGLDWQPGTGVLFETEHGPAGGDEVNIVERGANYGWPVGHHSISPEGMVKPFLVYTPSIAPGSGMFYRGKAFPHYRSDLLVGCLRGECILRLVLDGGRVVRQERLLEKEYGRIREVTEAPDGTIYFSTSQHDPPEGQPRPGYDQILRLVPISAGS